MKVTSRFQPLALSGGLLCAACTVASAALTLQVGDARPRRVELDAEGRRYFQSPEEGLWSVATNWAEGWPSGWLHANPEKVERSGDWTIVSGQLTLPGGVMEVRDAYRPEHGLVRGVRRWFWTGKEV